ncbi:MAG: hypothetical protein LBP79_00565 [Clostridiales bacterium]|nr:hypothetical protein [Clostridiales bacterium]
MAIKKTRSVADITQGNSDTQFGGFRKSTATFYGDNTSIAYPFHLKFLGKERGENLLFTKGFPRLFFLNKLQAK